MKVTRSKITSAGEEPSRDAIGKGADVLIHRAAVEIVDPTQVDRSSMRFSFLRIFTFQHRSSTPSGSKLAIAVAQAVTGVMALSITSGLVVLGRWVDAPGWLAFTVGVLAGAGYVGLYVKDTRHLTSIGLVDKVTGEMEGAPLPVKPLKIHKANIRRQHSKGGKRK